MKSKEFNKNLKGPKGLMNLLTIRTGLREKLLYFYSETFQDLYLILDVAEELDFFLLMHSTEEMLKSAPKSQSIIIRLHAELAFNSQILIQEIIDDYWAAYLCFQNGFTKQAQGILRNALELIVQMYYLRYLKKNGPIKVDRWVSGKRGIGKIDQKIKAIKRLEVLNTENLFTQLKQIYNRLCTATHSHKERMTSLNLPRMMWAKDMPSFESTEMLYTRGLFFSLMDLWYYTYPIRPTPHITICLQRSMRQMHVLLSRR